MEYLNTYFGSNYLYSWLPDCGHLRKVDSVVYAENHWGVGVLIQNTTAVYLQIMLESTL